ncbi:MAG TPA: beta-phosphoglucomutase family hydrolase [Acidimicrobiales bacterium]|nr:beta-phosphoglucomutase family hydrolase [Acidimicrobiales bacterium]
MLGLPDGVEACLFDMDGVLTKTAAVHAAAWKQTFDEVLRARARSDGSAFTPFDDHDDYDEYVDGRTRADGVRTFLASRGITLPEGSPDDAPDADTVFGVGNRKNQLLVDKIRTDGVEAYEGSVRYLRAAEAAGLRRACVSASANAADVLEAAGLSGFIEVRVDGVVVAEAGLRGKPAPDTFVEAARRLGVDPSAAAVFEDALAGVEAGAAGGFAAVVGVDRVGQADALRRHGASVVVRDLAELLGDGR